MPLPLQYTINQSINIPINERYGTVTVSRCSFHYNQSTNLFWTVSKTTIIPDESKIKKVVIKQEHPQNPYQQRQIPISHIPMPALERVPNTPLSGLKQGVFYLGIHGNINSKTSESEFWGIQQPKREQFGYLEISFIREDKFRQNTKTSRTYC